MFSRVIPTFPYVFPTLQVPGRGEGGPALAFVASAAPGLWGFARTARNEFPALAVAAVDDDDAAVGAALRAAAFAEPELLRGGRVPRIVRVDDPPPPPAAARLSSPLPGGRIASGRHGRYSQRLSSS